MDFYTEKLIKRRKSVPEIIYIVLVILIAVEGCYYAFIYLGMLSPIVILGIGYLAYYLVTMRNIEYEYIVTNGDIDIDMIINQRKRKRIFSANCKVFEVVARVNSDKYTPQIKSTKNVLDCSSHDSGADKWFIYLKHNGTPKVVIFEPEEKMIDNFRIFIPRKVFK